MRSELTLAHEMSRLSYPQDVAMRPLPRECPC